jgi:hypothetical protein
MSFAERCVASRHARSPIRRGNAPRRCGAPIATFEVAVERLPSLPNATAGIGEHAL